MDISEFFKNMNIETIAENTFIPLGIMTFAWWLLQNSFGLKALSASKPRRNMLNPVLAISPLLIWYCLFFVSVQLRNKITGNMTQSQVILWDNALLCVSSILTAGFILLLVKLTFARGLKGFGLYTNNIFKDFALGFITLLGTWPAIMLTFILITVVGCLIKGTDYQLPQHQELEFITNNPQISVRIIIAITTIIVVPIFEEIIFRGIFQSTIRAYIKRPWFSIFISAAIFASVHANVEHWPVIFILGTSLGYSYEKTGRLYPSIFIHAMFNATAVIATLIQS
ncbi:MAG TPA: type II CAAX endopeptidase family protein [Sedimentisphaerales bacterium]|nr:type II CAAX endopeptidase family protein [Sedimentisphaerales bacterium]